MIEIIIIKHVQSTSDNSNLKGELKKVRVIWSKALTEQQTLMTVEVLKLNIP